MFFEISLCSFYVLVFCFFIYRSAFFNVGEIKKRTFVFLFLLKIIAGTLVWATYTYYYTDRTLSDCFRYFDDATVIYNSLFDNPADYLKLVTGFDYNAADLEQYIAKIHSWHRQYNTDNLFNDNRTIVRFNAVIYLFSFGIFHVHTIFMCFVSLVGLTAIYKTLLKFPVEHKNILLISVFLFPSVLYWSSGVLKEGLVMLGIGIFTLSSINIIYFKQYSRKTIIGLLFSILLLLFCKIYVLLALTPSMLMLVVLRKKITTQPIWATGITILFFILIGFVMQFTNANPFKIIADKQVIFTNLARGGTYLIEKEKTQSDTLYFHPHQKTALNFTGKTDEYKVNGYYTKWRDHRVYDSVFINDSSKVFLKIGEYGKVGSDINLKEIKPTITSFLFNSPFAIFNALFRPLFFDSKNVIMHFSSFENLVLIILLLIALFNYKKSNTVIIMYCILFCISLAVIAGSITPVLGALVRYKMPLIPLYASACVMLFPKTITTKISNKLSRFL
jgi:hypothetical protein